MTRALLLALSGVALAHGLAAQHPGADMPMMHPHIYTHVAFDELEWRATGDEREVEYDAKAWIGGDFNRLWLKAAGSQSTERADGLLELQGLYGRTMSSFWNVLVGVRLDGAYGGAGGDTRAYAALGLEGLAPYWFEVEAFVFLSDAAEVSARLEASWETLLTQRLILESQAEYGVEPDVSSVEAGARLRYELVREIAPYAGYSWGRKTGQVGTGAVVVGLHLWY